jgi:hypothetical protein
LKAVILLVVPNFYKKLLDSLFIVVVVCHQLQLQVEQEREGATASITSAKFYC